MKTQNIKKQLNLSKRNLVELNGATLNAIKGGWTPTTLTNITTLTNFSKDTLCTSDNQQQ